MGAKEFQQTQSKTESKTGASQAAGETAIPAPALAQGSQVPHNANCSLYLLLPLWS